MTIEDKTMDPTKRVIKSHLTVRCFGNKRRDKEATREINEEKNAKSEIGTVDRNILVKEAVEPVYREERRLRAAHERHTIPYRDGGRLVLLSRFKEWYSEMEACKDAFYDEVDKLVANLPMWIDRTRDQAGSWWNPTLVPEADYLRKRFKVEHRWSSLTFGDFDVLEHLDDEYKAKVAEEIREQGRQDVEKAVGDVYRELLTRIKEMAKRVSPETSRIVRKPFEDFRDLVSMIPEMNLTGDPRLDNLYKEVVLEFGEIDPEEVKGTDDHARKRMSERLAEIHDKFAL